MTDPQIVVILILLCASAVFCTDVDEVMERKIKEKRQGEGKENAEGRGSESERGKEMQSKRKEKMEKKIVATGRFNASRHVTSNYKSPLHCSYLHVCPNFYLICVF